MDSIAYLPDPTDKTKVSDVVKSHSRYTVQSAKTLIQGQVELYDKYDKTNDKAAHNYLLASLTPLLSNKVSEKLDDADPFPIAWLQFLKAIQSTSIERFEDHKTSIKLPLPSQYPGENLEQLATQFRKDALELMTAGQYDNNLTLSMMKIFLLAGGSGNEDYRFPLRATKQKLEQALLDIGFKEKTAANNHMSELKLTHKDVCAQAEDTYRTLYDRKEWPPARNVRDSKAPPTAFGHIAIECDTPLTRAEVMTLIQNKPRPAGSPTKKPGTCHKCGKPGHWANECPDKPAGQRSQRPQSRNPRFSNNRHAARKPGWRSTPPAAGAPTTKKTDTHTFNWCATCKRWTTSTNTIETHTGAPRNASASTYNPPTSAAMMSLVQDPSVWVTEVRRFPSFSDLLYAFSILPLLFFKIGLVIALLPLLGSFLWFVDTFIVIPVLLPILKFDLPVLVSTFQAATLPVSNIVTPIIQPIRSSSSQHLFSAGPLLPSSDGLSSAVSLVRDLTAPPSTQCHEPPSHRRAPSQSIRTEGLHRKYPLHLRSMVHFVRRSQAPTAEERRLRDEIYKIQIRVAALEREVRLLSRLNYYDPTMESPWPRQQRVPDVRREGGSHARQRPTGTPVRSHLQRNSPTVNRTDNRQNQGQQNRRTPAPVPDRTTSNSPRTFDVSNAYYRPTDPEFYGHHRHSAAHIAHAPPPPPVSWKGSRYSLPVDSDR